MKQEDKERVMICPKDCPNANEDFGCSHEPLPEADRLEWQGDYPLCPYYKDSLIKLRDQEWIEEIEKIRINWNDCNGMADEIGEQLCKAIDEILCLKIEKVKSKMEAKDVKKD